MRKLRFVLWTLISLFVGVFIFAQFKKQYSYHKTIKVYGTEAKVYNYLASHLSKRSFFQNIQVKGTDIQPFEEGNISKIRFGRHRLKDCEERILKLEKNKVLNKVLICPSMNIESTIDMVKKYKTVDLFIAEKITIHSPFLRPLLLFDNNRISTIRDEHYLTLKSLIESYPDEAIHPDMLK